MTIQKNNLRQNKILIRNTILNLFGYGAPLIVAVFAIPSLITKMGTDRFGVLTLAWVLVSYLGLFDFGLSRALTKLVAERIGANRSEEIPGLIWTAVIIMGLLGGVVGGSIAFFLPTLVGTVLNIPDILEVESLKAFYVLVAFLPVVTVSIGLRGVLEAYQRFDVVTAVRIPLGIFVFLAPLVVVYYTLDLYYVAIVLMIGRGTALVIHFLFCLKIVPGFKDKFTPDLRMVRPLLWFGGWMSVTNIISPLMIFSDRFFIGSFATLTDVAYYATPSEIITKLFLIPIAMMAVFFPAFSTTRTQDKRRASDLFYRSTYAIMFTIFPVCLLVIAFADEGLTFWIGSAFAIKSAPVLKLLSVGVFLQCVGQAPYAFILGSGRPDWTAKLHLFELPFYLAAMCVATLYFGIVGAAIAWSARLALDSGFVFCLARPLLAAEGRGFKTIVWLCISGGAVLTGAFFLETLFTKFAYVILILVVFGWYAWQSPLLKKEY